MFHEEDKELSPHILVGVDQLVAYYQNSAVKVLFWQHYLE